MICCALFFFKNYNADNIFLDLLHMYLNLLLFLRYVVNRLDPSNIESVIKHLASKMLRLTCNHTHITEHV